MKTALFFLLFIAFISTQHLTLATEKEVVVDTKGNPLVPGEKYFIMDASDHDRAVTTEVLWQQQCPVSVVFGTDAKNVIFIPKDKDATSIKTQEDLYITFNEAPLCAKSPNWTIEFFSNKVYPVLIGPPEGVPTMEGSFRIRKSESQTGAYNIAFNIFNGPNTDYFLVTQAYGDTRDFYRLELCTDKGFDVHFIRYEKPTTLTST
ncbi:kunitz-type elastase inhibitor BrEI-like [Prosopis cineraria]|uniref:kunitz-type elastase inhibitor BrEI-like n=1 Tax=Prosopis cineraria TaxID=364024 RepID=UPI00240EB755|nr:kunitz-type elastase inhibitor BrEI-like [Prosopis cineraria]